MRRLHLAIAARFWVSRSHDVLFGARFDLVVEKLTQHFQCEVALRQMAHILQKFVRPNRHTGRFESRRAENTQNTEPKHSLFLAGHVREKGVPTNFSHTMV